MESFEIEIIEMKSQTTGLKIKVIGIGSAGEKSVEYLRSINNNFNLDVLKIQLGINESKIDNKEYCHNSFISDVIVDESITIDKLIENIKDTPKSITFKDEKNLNLDIDINEKINIALYGDKAISNEERKTFRTSDTDYIFTNTNEQFLDSYFDSFYLKLKEIIGYGNKEKESKIETFEDIKSILEGSDIVFVSAGLGGGTGTIVAPIIAKAAKEIGALSISIVTNPFSFEGSKRAKIAKEGLEELKFESDSVIVIDSERLLSIVEENLGREESFKMLDDILAQAISSISNVILSHGDNDINLDFTDVKTVMSHRGLALIGIGYSSGNNAAYDAARMAIEFPLLDNISIDRARGVFVHFDIHPDYPIMEIGEAMNIIEESVDKSASVIFGTTTNEAMDIDEVRITIVTTGFEDKNAIDELTSSEKKATLFGSNSNSINTLGNKKVVGGYNEENEDIDVPTFIRKQMDLD